jgi:SAM-dependent methyltransferase
MDSTRILIGASSAPRNGWLHLDHGATSEVDRERSTDRSPGSVPTGRTLRVEAKGELDRADVASARVALAEWRRWMAPGGELCFDLPDAGAALAALLDPASSPSACDGAETALRARADGALWTAARIERELESAGFDGSRVRVDGGRLVARAFVATSTSPSNSGMATDPTSSAPDAAARDESNTAPSAASHTAPTVDAPTRVLVWCGGGERERLRDLLATYGRVLTNRSDLELLCVFDGRATTAAAFTEAAGAAFAATLGTAHGLRLGCVALPEDAAGLEALRAAAAIRIAIHDEPLQLACLDLAGHVDPARLARAIGGGITEPANGALDDELVRAASDLHPWFYPVELAGHRVVPGLGSPCTPQYLESRTAHRRQMLVDAVLERVDMRGRRLLDLACNCAYWTSAWARAGAAELFGLEGCPEHVAQARLHWSNNDFLPAGAWRFEQGDIANAADWKTIRDNGPFDVTLCAGILYHVRNYEEILRWAALQTREVLVVDTRVQDGDEVLIDEPGDLRFNAIESTRRKVVPNRARLIAVLEELGLSCEVLDVPFATALGVDHDDDYAAGRRVTIVARKVRSALPSARMESSSTDLR